jgi:hypothetical protein
VGLDLEMSVECGDGIGRLENSIHGTRIMRHTADDVRPSHQ